MPEDTPPEWQAAEYAKARLDLQLEVLNGVSLNDIRRKYNQDTVEGDDEPMNVGDANVMLDDAAEKFSDGVTSTVTSNVVPMETRPTPLEDFAPRLTSPGHPRTRRPSRRPLRRRRSSPRSGSSPRPSRLASSTRTRSRIATYERSSLADPAATRLRRRRTAPRRSCRGGPASTPRTRS